MIKFILLIWATMIWGLGFVGTRWTLMDYSPIWSNSLRFIFAGLIVIPYLVVRRVDRHTPLDHLRVLGCSIVLMVGLQLQTIGIGLTTLAKSGFLTTFYALFVPLLSLVIYRTKFRWTYWPLLGLAMTGIFLLCEAKIENFNLGDFFIVLSAIFFSIHILMIDRYSQLFSPLVFNGLQCFYMGGMGLVFALLYEGPTHLSPLLDLSSLFRASSLAGFIILSLLSSLLAFSIQVYAQRDIPPHVAGLIFLLESIFASFFGHLFFAEKLSPTSLVGAFLVLMSVALVPFMATLKKAKQPVPSLRPESV